MIDLATKNKAIDLRRDGRSYSEILREIPVAKSTLSSWLRNVNLSKPQKQQLTEKKRLASLRGAATRHQQRVEQTEKIFHEAQADLGKISKRDLKILGIALYWAEGSKEKEYRPGSRVQFGNSDPKMIKIFLRWLEEIIKLDPRKIIFEIYIHEQSANDISIVRKFWSKTTGHPFNSFKRVYFKKHKVTTRKNCGGLYYGLLRVTVRASSALNRRIMGYVQAIAEQC
jgi:transposase-like protein